MGGRGGLSGLKSAVAEGKHDINVNGGNLRYSIEADGTMWINGIYVSKDARNKGVGTELINKAKTISDRSGKPIELFAIPIRDSDLDEEGLISWYKKRGFEYKGSGLANSLTYKPKNRK